MQIIIYSQQVQFWIYAILIWEVLTATCTTETILQQTYLQISSQKRPMDTCLVLNMMVCMIASGSDYRMDRY